MKGMDGKELAKELAERTGLTQKKAGETIKALISIIRGEVQGQGRFALSDLGIFTLRPRKARVTNFGKVPAHKIVHFAPSAGFKRSVNLR